jgi:hypothetical protein
MKKFLIAGSSLAAVAAAGSAGAVDVTLGGSIDMGVKYGVGKAVDSNHMQITENYQSISISVAAAGTTDAGLKFGGSFGISTADELVFDPYKDDGAKHAFKLVNSDTSAGIRGVAYNVSGGAAVSAGQIVSVKINSAWQGVEDSVVGYNGTIAALDTSSAICKLGGEVASAAAGNVTRGAGNSESVVNGIARAGQLTAGGAANMTANINATLVVNAASGNAIVDADGAIDADKIFMGPFMEVMMTSSTTKMVVGGVCVTNAREASKTNIHMDVVSRVLHVSDASIYIEGGFGKLSVGTGAYGGSVAGVGGAGDQVKIDGNLNATLSSVSFMGLAGSGAVALDTINLGQRPNYAFGTSVDLLGLTIAVEMEDNATVADDPATTAVDESAGTTGWIDLWDAGTSYDLNGMSVAVATDSSGAWAMSLGYELLGFSMSSVVENIAKGGSEKAGLNIDTSFSTSLNGVGISVGLDEDLAWTIGASYTMGNSGLSMYVGYAQADEGGKIGATMSF